MKRVYLACFVALVLTGAGCSHDAYNVVGGKHAGGHGLKHGPPHLGPAQPGPPTGTVAYPYYTTRGPRDFLVDDPPSIGY